ncbi:MAG: hypothetical protein HY078_07045 [Elusimicrobia bacterium]|nr:hypothetical protein [Elusimicrobiota bacterium]
MKSAKAYAAAGFVALAALAAVYVRAGDKKAPDVRRGKTASATAIVAYPNDLGPATIDVSSYPKPMQERYKLFAARCSACHSIARPINSQFLELTEEEIEAAKAKDPEAFDDIMIVRAEPNIWTRYIKRMMSKPACPVKGEEGKKIWEFLVYDSKVRKTGANAKAWRTHRERLVRRFEKGER